MTNPIIIKKIEVQGFRVFRKPQTIFQNKKRRQNLAVLAPNGAGKSSLVDSLEYYFADKATLERLGRRSSKILAGPKYVRHISADKNDVKVHIQFKQGRDEFGDSRTGDPISKVAQRIRPLIKVPFIIRDYELRTFVQENRYDELVKWFGLEHLRTIQKNLQLLENRIKNMMEDNTSIEACLERLKSTNSMFPEWNEPTILKWLNEEMLANLRGPVKFENLSSNDPAFQELVQRNEMEQKQAEPDHLDNLLDIITSLFAQHTNPREEPTGLITVFEKAILDFKTASANEQKIRDETSNYVFKEVWANSQELLKGSTDLDKCPVCNTAFPSSPLGTRDAVLRNLRINLENLDRYQKAETEKNNADAGLGGAYDDLKTKLDEFTRWFDSKYQYGPVTDYNKLLQSWKPGEDVPDSMDATRNLARLYARVVDDTKNTQQVKYTYGDALKMVERLLEIKADLCRIENTKSNLETIKDSLAEQAKILNRAIVGHIQKLVDRLQDETRTIYKEIQGPDAPISTIELALSEEGNQNQRGAHVIIDFMNSGKKVPPNSVFSESQNRTLALAIRLAAISMFNTEFKIIALDDVTLSYDDERRQHIAALLQKRFNEFQIILTTHDRFFYRQLRNRLPPDRWGFKEITHVIDEYGPKIEDNKTLEALINEKSINNEITGNDIRQAQEEWLTRICSQFRTSVIFSPGMRFGLSALASSLQNFLKEKKLNPPKVGGYHGNYLDQIMNPELQNFTSHYNEEQDMSVSSSNLKVVWAEFLEFKSHFKCPKCGKDKFFREQGQKPRCGNCKTEFAFASDDNGSGL